MILWTLCSLFFFKQKTAYEMRISDWSSDVCSSDLFEPAGLRRLVQFAGDIGRCRGVVDEDGILGHAGKGAIVAVNHRAQIIVVADAGHDQFGTGGCRLRTRGLPALVLCNPAVGFIRRAVPDRDLMARLPQMPGHRGTGRAACRDSGCPYV